MIERTEDSVIFRNWGITPKFPKLVYHAFADIDKQSLGRLPAYQWVIPNPNDRDLTDGLNEVRDLVEFVSNPLWKDANESISFPTEEEMEYANLINQPEGEIVCLKPNTSLPRI